MIVILEGPDNAGKTTLANSLGKAFQSEIIHPGARPENFLVANEYCNAQLAFINAHSKNHSFHWIFDRVTCISDFIYGLQNHPERGAYYSKHIFAILEHPISVIYCRPPDSVITDFSTHTRADHDTDESISFAVNNIHNIIGLYDGIITGLNNHKIRKYDYTTDQLDDIIDFILDNQKRVAESLNV